MLSPESISSDAIVPLTGSECPFVLVLSSKTCEHPGDAEEYWTLDSAQNTRKRGSSLLCLCDMRGSKFQRCFVPVSLYPAHSGRITHHDLAT